MSSKIPVLLGLCLSHLFAAADQAPAPVIRTAPATTTAALPAPIAVGRRPPPPPPPVEKPDFQVRSTQVRELEVSEAPPMPGLPPVTGTIRVTVHEVDDPGLPDPPPPPLRRPLDPGKTPETADFDGDGLNNLFEVLNGMDPMVSNPVPDTDADGARDTSEQIRGTNPNHPDHPAVKLAVTEMFSQ